MHTPAIGDILEFGLYDYLEQIQERLIERLNRYIVEAFRKDALSRVRQRFLLRRFCEAPREGLRKAPVPRLSQLPGASQKRRYSIGLWP